MLRGTPAACLRCGVGPMSRQRTGAVIEHHGRGLCEMCWCRSKKDGTLDRYPRITRPHDELIEDYELIQGRTMTRRLAAERLGVTKSCLEQALLRQKRKEESSSGTGNRHS